MPNKTYLTKTWHLQFFPYKIFPPQKIPRAPQSNSDLNQRFAHRKVQSGGATSNWRSFVWARPCGTFNRRHPGFLSPEMGPFRKRKWIIFPTIIFPWDMFDFQHRKLLSDRNFRASKVATTCRFSPLRHPGKPTHQRDTRLHWPSFRTQNFGADRILTTWAEWKHTRWDVGWHLVFQDSEKVPPVCWDSHTPKMANVWLVVGFNPFEKYESKWESSPIFGVKIKNIWNHQPANVLCWPDDFCFTSCSLTENHRGCHTPCHLHADLT